MNYEHKVFINIETNNTQTNLLDLEFIDENTLKNLKITLENSNIDNQITILKKLIEEYVILGTIT